MKNENVTNLKISIFYGSTFFLCCCLFSLITINLFRLGLQTPKELNLLITLLIINVSLSPFLINYKLDNLENGFVYVKISLVILISFFLPLLGFVSSLLYYFVILTLISISIYNLRDITKKINYKFLLILIILSIFFIVNFIPWKIEYFYSPEITLYGLGGNQTMQGAALTHIFKNYKMISLGVDGLENFLYKYHYGTYIWWASISTISNYKPLMVIPFIQQAFLIPMIFFVTFITTLAFLKNLLRIELLLCTIFFFILFDIFSGRLHYDSETYTSSIIILVLTLPMIKFIINRENKFNKYLLAVLIFLIPVISSLKLTTGYLYCIILGLLFVYNREKKINFLFILLVVVLGVLSLKLFMPSSYTELNSWRLYSSYNQLFRYQNFFCILLPTLYLLNIIFKIKIKNNENKKNIIIKNRSKKNRFKVLSKWLLNKKVSFSKIIVITYFLSIIPIFIIPIGSTGVYNIVHLNWIFIPLILSSCVNVNFFKSNNFNLISICIILLFTVMLLKPANIKLEIVNKFFENTLGKEIERPRELRNIIFKNIKDEKKIFSAKQFNNIENNSLNIILNKTENYFNKYGKNFAIYIPENNFKFWNIIKKNNLPYWCSSTTLVIPSLTGVQSIKGVQDPKKCETYYIAGPSEYNQDSYLENLTSNEVCIHAKKKKIKYIFQINDINNITENKFLKCS